MSLRKYIMNLSSRQFSLSSRLLSDISGPKPSETKEITQSESEDRVLQSQPDKCDIESHPKSDSSLQPKVTEESQLQIIKEKFTFFRPFVGFGRLSSMGAEKAPKPPVPWDEKRGTRAQIAKAKRRHRLTTFKNFNDRQMLFFQTLRRILIYRDDYDEYMEKKQYLHKIFSQEFSQERVFKLGPDLAAAHFICYRGGFIKFSGHPNWIGPKERVKQVPNIPIPGYYIEAINAHGTDLLYEGLMNIRYLIKLKWLSLRGLENLNNFALDLISGEYGSQLEYLDLTDCKGLTYHGLSCFYRFKKLKLLDLTGIDHPVELKASCILLQDFLPDLEILGVDFSIPKSEGPLVENIQNPENEVKQVHSA